MCVLREAVPFCAGGVASTALEAQFLPHTPAQPPPPLKRQIEKNNI